MAGKLPADCLRIILSHLASFSVRLKVQFFHVNYSEDSRVHLTACALVCRSWVRPANEILYKYIYGSYETAERAEKLVATVEQNPHLADLVQVLHVEEVSRRNAHCELRRNQIARILKVARNLHCYTCIIYAGDDLPFWKAVLPTSQNPRLTTLGLLVLRWKGPSIEDSAFNDLPTSIANLSLEASYVSTVQLSLPNLRRLRFWQWTDAGFSLKSFSNCARITSLDFYEPDSTPLSQVLTSSIGSNLRRLRIDAWYAEEAVNTGVLASLERLDLLGPCPQLDPTNFPPSVQMITWKTTEARIVEMLRLLSDPDYLPNLRSIPALYWYLFGMTCKKEGASPLSAHEKLRKQAFETLRSRGLTLSISPRTELPDPERAYPVFDAALDN